MVAYTYQRGHKIEFSTDAKSWVYSNDLSSIEIERPCIRCGKLPTMLGHDSCLGHIEHVTSACCGHGIEKPFIMKDN